jgi:hypothetical protein
MKRPTQALLVLTLLCGFTAGVWTAAHIGWGSNAVVATITNTTDEAATSVKVRFKTCGTDGIALVGTLPPGSSREVHFSVCGEASYVDEWQFASGRVIKGSEQYVESGARIGLALETVAISH